MRGSEKRRDKAQKMVEVAEATLRLVSLQGVEALNVSRVARSADVSRPWIYKYIGRGKDDLVEFAARHFALVLSRVEERPVLRSREDWFRQARVSLEDLFEVTQSYPWMLPLYYRFKGTPTPIGRVISTMESRYFDVSSEEITAHLGWSKADARTLAEALAAARLGLAHRQLVDGFLDESDKERFFRVFLRLLDAL